jgi:hypothetical protein
MAIYFLDEQKTKKLSVKPKAFYKNTVVTYNDVVLDTIPTADELRIGKTYNVEPGSQIIIQLKKSEFQRTEMIDITLNGKLVKGSGSDPMTGINGAFAVLIIIGIFNFIIGIVGVVSDGEGMLAEMGVGLISILAGLLFVGLAFVLRSTKSMVPIIVAIVLLVIDMLLTISAAMDGGGRFPTGVGMKVIFIIGLVRGIKGVQAYNEQKKQEAQ